MSRKLEEEEEVLQAVVITDSFNKRFRPLTLEKPRCLLKLLNVPLIEYTLEFLAVSGVQEIFLVCCVHAEQIKNYIKKSRWGKGSIPDIKYVVSQELYSHGDALRELDQKGLLKSDFVLVSGDIISNMNLEKALKEHKARKLTDKNSMMTMVLKEASPGHRTRSKGEEGLFVLDAKTKELLHYESLEVYPPKKKVEFDIQEIFKYHQEIEVRNNLIDCQIDICSLEVPPLFTENFDYQDIRKDFVKGILESEILTKTFYAHILTGEYAARVRSTQMYDSVSRDIMARWTFPIVPDSNILGNTTYVCSRPNIYKEKHSLKLARSAVLEHHVTIGRSTEIGDNSKIKNSVIGKGCIIGANVIIDGSYIWDNVVIGDNCRVFQSILADKTHVLNNVHVSKGCILSSKVVVGPDVVIPEHTKLFLKEFLTDENKDANIEACVASSDLIGVEGNACLWNDAFDGDEDEDIDPRNIVLGSIGYEQEMNEEEYPETSDSEISDSDFQFRSKSEIAYDEIAQVTQRALNEGLENDVAALELNTLKMSLDIKFTDLRMVVGSKLIEIIDLNNLADGSRKVIERWGGLLQKFIFSELDEVETIGFLEDHCLLESEDRAKKITLFMYVLKYLYDQDIISEEAILKWHGAPNEKSTEVKASVSTFVTWLKQAEEESDEGSD
ncbi:hypothetical protein HDU92_001754 [Lobulomyces angularis]|nr:hypothetical protein HDU92_001754 [Lobulomyces angularis]